MTLALHIAPDLASHRVGQTVRLDGAEAHHAVSVRRMRVGESLFFTDGAGCSAQVEVSELGKRELTARIIDLTHADPPTPAITVAQAIPKGDRAELAVQLLTEIGVSTIVPWQAERCVARWNDDKAPKALARWRNTATEAAKQARRVWHPHVTEPHDTTALAALCAGAEMVLMLSEEADEDLVGVLDADPAGDLLVIVGPEGGITGDEVATLTSSGARSVRLGSEVLRTSTAGVAAVSAVLSRTDRWRHFGNDG